jgi:adenylyl-sulfate kinase
MDVCQSRENETRMELKHAATTTSIHQAHASIPPQASARVVLSKAPIIWLTGLSGAGKSTLAKGLKRELDGLHIASVILDGDALRLGLTSDLGFTDVDRDENVRRVSEVAKLFSDAGLLVIVALISPRKTHREKARALAPGRFREVYVNGSLEACRRRDVKGLYAQALMGKIGHFTGLGAPYEAPEKADLVLNTDTASTELCVGSLLRDTLHAIEPS